MTIIQMVLQKKNLRIWTWLSRSEQKLAVGFFEHSNENYGSLKDTEFLAMHLLTSAEGLCPQS
jgi:hypothetical protein